MSLTEPRLIPEAAVQAAFDWLVAESATFAAARANVLRKEYAAKKIFAKLFRAADGSVEMRKAWAMCHDDYAQAMEDVFTAEETWTLMQDQKNKAEAILEAWRTQEASQRAVHRIR